jgi:hypothetical protein
MMKKENLSILVVLLTMITVASMFLNNESIKLKNINAELISLPKINKGNLRITKLFPTFSLTKVLNSSSSSEQKESEIRKQEKSSSENAAAKKEDTIKGKRAEKVDNIGREGNTISVFKISREDYENVIPLGDKIKVASIAGKISPADFAKINNYLIEEDEEEAVKKIFELLKVRLSSKDYNKIREAAEKFIDFEALGGVV